MATTPFNEDSSLRSGVHRHSNPSLIKSACRTETEAPQITLPSQRASHWYVPEFPHSSELSDLHESLLRYTSGYDTLEILVLILSLASKEISHLELKLAAESMLNRFGSLRAILAISVSTPEALALEHTYQISLRVVATAIEHLLQESLRTAPLILNACTVNDIFRAHLLIQTKPSMNMIFVDADNKLIRFELHSEGSVDHVTIYPREILKRCLALNAAGLFLLRYQPDGPIIRNSEETSIIKKIQSALAVVKIVLMDYIVLSKQESISVLHNGILSEGHASE